MVWRERGREESDLRRRPCGRKVKVEPMFAKLPVPMVVFFPASYFFYVDSVCRCDVALGMVFER